MRKILIANRSEIALRLAGTMEKMGFLPVMVYSSADRPSLHVTGAMEAHYIGESPSSKSYLVMDKIIQTAKNSGCFAIHPGYGFLSENADFAEQTEKAGLVFIGPSSKSIRALGNKLTARTLMDKAGIQVASGSMEPISSKQALEALVEKIGLPILMKAAGGGGGKGMRIVRDKHDLFSALENCTREAGSSFADSRVFVERYLEQAQHIEFQVLGDNHGGAWHFGHRECSVQRRHQKLLEETPSPNVTAAETLPILERLLKIMREVGYNSLGTFEFLRTRKGEYYFLEMNTRLQVEHSVTEMTYGVDLVEYQIRAALGEKLNLNQSELVQKGHALQCRICAEDPLASFAPSPGTVTDYYVPKTPDLRVDSNLHNGYTVPLFYDPMVAKLSVFAQNRQASTLKMLKVLKEFRLNGFPNNRSFHRWLLTQGDFQRGQITTDWLSFHEKPMQENLKTQMRLQEALTLAVLVFRQAEFPDWMRTATLRATLNQELFEFFASRRFEDSNCFVEVKLTSGEEFIFSLLDEGNQIHALCQGRSFQIFCSGASFLVDGMQYEAFFYGVANLPLKYRKHKKENLGGVLNSPINGKILKICARNGDKVSEGDLLVVIEAMKMENEIRAPVAGQVISLDEDLVSKTVNRGDFLLEIQK